MKNDAMGLVAAAASPMKVKTVAFLCLLGVVFLSLTPPARAQATGFVIPHQFSGYKPDGSIPIAALIRGTDGNFYGTSQGSFASGGGSGTIYKITPAGAFTVLHTFDQSPDFSTNHDGAFPQAGVIQGTDGNFYGTAFEGGSTGSGTIYKLTPGGVFTVLHTFSRLDDNSDNADGYYGQGGLVQGKDGNLYGAAYGGGTHGAGTVYKITTAGAFTTLHSFGAGEGANPMTALVQASDGNLYGTTYNGGLSNQGTIYKITTDGNFSVFYDFDSDATQASSPYGNLIIGTDGNFYGTTYIGGPNGGGEVFKLTAAKVLTVVYGFHGAEGQNLIGGVVEGADGSFYGTTFGGGGDLHGGGDQNGTVYKVTPAGVLTTLHVFSTNAGGDMTNADGAYPESGLAIGTDGNFYGVTSLAGPGGGGTVYKVTSSGTFTTLHGFGLAVNADGASPSKALLLAQDGNFYGATSQGGSNGHGQVFKLTPSGVVTPFHVFQGGTDSNDPDAALVQGSDGSFYGTTLGGGVNGTGTVYKLSSSGATVFQVSFGGFDSNGFNTGGAEPTSSVTLDSAGNIYVVTSRGGTGGTGTVFEITASGEFNFLYNFSALDDKGINTDGAYANGNLTLARDGNFYGTTSQGGTGGSGTIFKMTAAGVLTTLHNFAAYDANYLNTDGFGPGGTLVQASDDNFYGATTEGGTTGYGTTFKLTAAGGFTTLHTFSATDPNGHNVDGASPQPTLTLGRDGFFYGSAFDGGTGRGTVFRMTPAGAVTTLHNFPYSYDGDTDVVTAPQGYIPSALVQAADGSFYGTNYYGGTNGNGTIFQITFVPVITSAKTASATVGQAFTYQITATGSPTSYGVQGLPSGLTVNASTGLISGTPKTAGTVSLTVNTFNSAGKGTGTVTLTIKATAPVITSATTATATQGTAFSYQITATNNPTAYGVQGLPAGLAVDSKTGLISGTPKAAGKVMLTLNAINSAGKGSATLTLTIKAAPPVITSAATASGKIGQAYSFQITASNQPTTFGVQGLPTGLAVDSKTGLITGTPKTAGKYTLTLNAYNAVGKGSATLTLTVSSN